MARATAMDPTGSAWRLLRRLARARRLVQPLAMGPRLIEVTVRPTRPGDEPFVLALGERSFAMYSRDASATMRAILSDDEARGAVAEVDDVRVGFVVVKVERLGRPFGPWSRPAVARIDAIAVHPDHHRRGVGRHLLAWAEELALSRGSCALSLHTALSNEPARALFAATGFYSFARLGPFYARGRHAVSMVKPLDPGR